MIVLIVAVVIWIALSVLQLFFPKPRTLLQGNPPSAAWIEHAISDKSGKPLAFWRFTVKTPAARVLICHGYFANRNQVQGIASRLADANYDVLVMELRGHGKRKGPCTFGLREAEDGISILEHVENESGALPVALLGFSMGGAVMCAIAAKHPEVKAVIADSLYSEFFPILVRGFWQERHIPKFPFCYLTWMGLQAALGGRLGQLDPVKSAPQRSQRLLLIEGGQDRRVPRCFADKWYSRWAGPKERWCDPDAGHVGIFARNPGLYTSRVVSFINGIIMTG